jgi:pimeloyl-ACP methyl ester carboxylesterase
MTQIILIPGLVCDGHVWEATRVALTDLSVHVANVTTQLTITAMALDLLDQHSGPLVLMGHSMGGRVAMEMARIAPDRIHAMALLNTGMPPQGAGEPAKRQVMIDLCNTHGMAALADAWLPGMMAEGIVPDPAVLDDLRAMVCRMTPQIHERQMRALLGRPDARLSMPAYCRALILVTGRQDIWSPVAQHQDIAALCPQARLEIIENAGHFAPVEQPSAVAKVLSDWTRDVLAPQQPEAT